jgi:hypothetical protein
MLSGNDGDNAVDMDGVWCRACMTTPGATAGDNAGLHGLQ